MPGSARKPAYNPERRCHWFDNNGRPYKRLDGGLGCPRIKTCYFAHPTDGEHWRNSRPSGEPPLQYLTDDEYRLIVGRHRSPGRGLPPDHPVLNRRRSASAERERRRRERERSLGRRRSASREREPTLASRLRGRPPSPGRDRPDGRPVGYRNSRSRSPMRGRMQRTPPEMSGPSRVARPYGTLPDGPRNAGAPGTPGVFPKVEAQDVPMRDLANQSRQPVVRESSIASSHLPSHQLTPSRAIPTAPHAMTAVAAATSTSPAPSLPTSDAIKSILESSTLQWQQISSAVAAATSAVPRPDDANGAAGELSTEEKHKIWTSRIELLASAARIHSDCRSMDNDIKDYKQLVESFSYNALPAEDRNVIEGHLHTLQAQLGQKSDDLKRILTQLTAAKFWPTHTHKQPPGSGQDNVNAEVATQIQTLKGSVSQLHTMLQAVRTRWEQVLAQLQSDGNSSQPNTFLAEAIVPSELEKIRDTLTSIEERLGTVENEVTRPKEVFLEQVDAIVAENAQSIVLASTGNVHAQPPAPRAALTDEQLKMLQTLQQNAAATGQQVNQLSKQVTQLATHNDQLKTENMQLQAENAQLRQQLEEMQTMQTSHGDSKKIDRMQAEMRALNAAVMAYISHSPNAQPAGPTADTLAQQITPQIVKSIPELIAPELQAMRNQLQETLRAQQSESAKELSLKMSLTLQAVEAIRGLMGGTHKSPRVPAVAAQANGNSSS